MPRYSYGTGVRKRLQKLHRTQRQLAAAVGYSPSYISMFLSGQLQNPTLQRTVTKVLEQWERK